MELNGTLTRISDDDFDLRTEDGIQMTIRFDGVEKFKIDDQELKKIIDRKILSNENKYVNQTERIDNNQKNINRINRNIINQEKKSDYQKFGINYGTPAVFNIVYGYTSSKLGFHLSGGYWDDILFGFQLGPSINLGKNEDSELNIVIAYGFQNIFANYSDSFNFLLDANVYGLHIEFGLGIGVGNFTSTHLLFQLGYAFRWKK